MRRRNDRDDKDDSFFLPYVGSFFQEGKTPCDSLAKMHEAQSSAIQGRLIRDEAGGPVAYRSLRSDQWGSFNAAKDWKEYHDEEEKRQIMQEDLRTRCGK